MNRASWSQQARNMADIQIDNINVGYATLDDAVYLFANSYRAPIIRYRAAKRLHRAVKTGKVHENLNTYTERFCYNEIKGLYEYREYEMPQRVKEAFERKGG